MSQVEILGNQLTIQADLFIISIDRRVHTWVRHEGVKSMFSKEVIVRCESGLHNRQATYFVQKANEFNCSIWLESENRKMNAKSLLGIMSLGIITGAVVTLSASGSDAEEAVNALEALLQRDVY